VTDAEVRVRELEEILRDLLAFTEPRLDYADLKVVAARNRALAALKSA
jgi:hypothetical protein